jgi:hypothetical protein
VTQKILMIEVTCQTLGALEHRCQMPSVMALWQMMSCVMFAPCRCRVAVPNPHMVDAWNPLQVWLPQMYKWHDWCNMADVLLWSDGKHPWCWRLQHCTIHVGAHGAMSPQKIPTAHRLHVSCICFIACRCGRSCQRGCQSHSQMW